VIVLDASAAVEVLLHTTKAQAVKDRLSLAGQTLHAPHLIDIEVVHAVRRYAVSGIIDPERCEAALIDFMDLALIRYPHNHLLPRIWELRNSMSAYDAVYVALAETLNAPLVTCDQKLARAEGHGARIELV
jgi:predicted nucleic acid-binding protein